jgi:hypothetical protein
MAGFKINNLGGPMVTNPQDSKADWLRDHRFRLVQFLGIDTANNTDILAVKDVDMPEKQIEVLSIQTPGTVYKFAKSAKYSGLKIVFYGTGNLLRTLHKLQEEPHSLAKGLGNFGNDSIVGRPTGYMKEIQIDIYENPQSTEGYSYIFKNAFISKINQGRLSYTSSDIKSIDVEIEYSFFEVRSVSNTADYVVERF